jgi:DegV family protein with EDD domain
MLRIVTDSTADMPPSWQEDIDLHIVPVNIHFGEKTYQQGVDLTNDEFYALVEELGTIPKTSQPSPHQFITSYREIAKKGDSILSIHVTAKLSGTFKSAQMAAKELEGEIHVIPFDSAAGSAALGYMCKEAREMDRKGASLEQILERLETIRASVSVILTLDTLEYARMSGRVKALQAALASLLRVKPIVDLQDGLLNMTEQVRTRQRAIDRVIDIAQARYGDRLVNAAVVHAQDPEYGSKLLERVRERFNCQEIILTELSTGIAANLGPGTVGIIVYPTST